VTVETRPAGSRARTEQPGIVTWHSFSSGPYYDAQNVSFGPLVAHDEHVLAGSAGFPRHAHRGVDIVSWVVHGTLRHDDRTIRAGMLLHQHAGSGIHHEESNAEPAAPLRLVQVALLAWTPPSPSEQVIAPSRRRSGATAVLELGAATLYLVDVTARSTAEIPAAPLVHLFVTEGALVVAGRRLAAGDAGRLRAEPDVRLSTETEAHALVWSMPVAGQ
jgi:quercetin 2,3-dioxygenase